MYPGDLIDVKPEHARILFQVEGCILNKYQLQVIKMIHL